VKVFCGGVIGRQEDKRERTHVTEMKRGGSVGRKEEEQRKEIKEKRKEGKNKHEESRWKKEEGG
jgi:hypothetical protein